jgi:hypothetical protein
MNMDKPFDQYVMFDLKVLHPDIWYFENVISYPELIVPFIDELDKDARSHSRIPAWEEWTASNDKSVVYGATKTILASSFKNSSGDEKIDQKTLYILNSFIMAVEMCADRYLAGHHLDKNNYNLDLNAFYLKKWNQGQNMGPHFDGQDGDSRLAFSIVTYINEDYEGGEISFPNHNITVKPKAGSLIMFPSQLPFIHQVNMIKSGTRYMIPNLVYNK